jgi:fumarate hydratase class I
MIGKGVKKKRILFCVSSDKQEVVAYPELGMEAIYKITVKDFPAFILVDDKGNDFYAPLMG